MKVRDLWRCLDRDLIIILDDRNGMTDVRGEVKHISQMDYIRYADNDITYIRAITDDGDPVLVIKSN